MARASGARRRRPAGPRRIVGTAVGVTAILLLVRLVGDFATRKGILATQLDLCADRPYAGWAVLAGSVAKRETKSPVPGGRPARGRAAIRKYGCVSCHKIPGVRGKIADPSLAGPSLAGIARRDSIGGAVTNRPDNLVRWLRDPLSVDPLTSMPDLGVTPRDARDIASYLYTLK